MKKWISFSADLTPIAKNSEPRDWSKKDSNPLLIKEKCDNYPLYEGQKVNAQNKPAGPLPTIIGLY